MKDLRASAKLIAVVGDPVAHSMTPTIQNAELERLGLDTRNAAFHVRPDKFAEALCGAQALGILGFMVTIPHKQIAFELADEVDELAGMVEAANLLHFGDDGKVRAYNTDGGGASESLRRVGVSVRGRKVTLLGAGGAGRCLAFQFALAGAAEIGLFNRTPQRGAEVAREVAVKASFPHIKAYSLEGEALEASLADADLLINATSIGMAPDVDESLIPANLHRPDLIVFDIVYNPLETKLLREARAVGAKAVDGVGMLVHTNVRAVEICLGVTPSFDHMRDLCVAELMKRRDY